MTRVVAVDTVIVDLPFRRPHRFSVLTAEQQSVLLVRVRTDDGVVGVGEGAVPGGPWWGGESIEGMQLTVERYLSPLVLGADPAEVGRLRTVMDRVVAGNAFAKAGLEVALYDAWARTLGVPVHALLGGLHRSAIPVTWAIGAADPGEAIEEAGARIDGGHASIKLKMGAIDPDDDVARIEAIAAGLAGRTSLRVDLNGAWDELTATRLLPRLQDADIALVEQPTPAWNVDALVRLSALLRIPIMADESLRSEHDALALAARRAAGVFSLKVTKSGGFTVTQRIAAVAQAAGIPCHGGTSIEGAVGTLAALHMYCATPAVTWGSELFGPLLMTHGVLTEPLTYRDGALHLPSGPGLGIDLDDERVARWARN